MYAENAKHRAGSNARALRAQGCGMGPAIAMDAQMRIEGIPGIEDANVEVVWDPP